MRKGLWPDSDPAEVDELLGRRPPDPVVLVAERDAGGLCAFAELASRRYAEGCRTSPVAYLEGIWVDRDVRRTGVALALVRAGVEWARSRGFTEFASDCDIDNEVSRALHAAARFEETQRIVCFRLPMAPE